MKIVYCEYMYIKIYIKYFAKYINRFHIYSKHKKKK